MNLTGSHLIITTEGYFLPFNFSTNSSALLGQNVYVPKKERGHKSTPPVVPQSANDNFVSALAPAVLQSRSRRIADSVS